MDRFGFFLKAFLFFIIVGVQVLGKDHRRLCQRAFPVPVDIILDGRCRPGSLADGQRHRLQPDNGIAAGKYPVHAGHEILVGIHPLVVDGLNVQSVIIHGLTRGHDDRIRRDERFRPGDGDRSGPAAGVGLLELHLHAQKAHHAPLVRDEFYRIGVISKQDAFFHGFVDLGGDGRHLHPGPTVDNAHVRAQPLGHTGAVHGRVPAADDHHILADLHPFAAVDLFEKINPGIDVVRGFARKIDRHPFLGAGSQKHRIIFTAQLIQCKIDPHLDIALQLNAQIENLFDFLS